MSPFPFSVNNVCFFCFFTAMQIQIIKINLWSHWLMLKMSRFRAATCKQEDIIRQCLEKKLWKHWIRNNPNYEYMKYSTKLYWGAWHCRDKLLSISANSMISNGWHHPLQCRTLGPNLYLSPCYRLNWTKRANCHIHIYKRKSRLWEECLLSVFNDQAQKWLCRDWIKWVNTDISIDLAKAVAWLRSHLRFCCFWGASSAYCS